MEKEEAVVGEDRLPDEIWSAIFFYAGVKATASQICLVCKRWHQICEDEGLWKLFCHTPSYKNLLPQVQQTGTWKARCKAIRIFAAPPPTRGIPNAKSRDSAKAIRTRISAAMERSTQPAKIQSCFYGLLRRWEKFSNAADYPRNF